MLILTAASGVQGRRLGLAGIVDACARCRLRGVIQSLMERRSGKSLGVGGGLFEKRRLISSQTAPAGQEELRQSGYGDAMQDSCGSGGLGRDAKTRRQRMQANLRSTRRTSGLGSTFNEAALGGPRSHYRESAQMQDPASEESGTLNDHLDDDSYQPLPYDPNAEFISNPDEFIASPSRDESDEPYQRTHPLTLHNRFGTSPLTLDIPFAEAINDLMGTSTPQFIENAHRVFGGPGLPLSTASVSRPGGGANKQSPIPLTTFAENMRPSEAELFLGVLWPAIFASSMSALVETRKRLGTHWAERCVRKAEANDLRILDAGGAGAAVAAVREMLRAEWERMHEESASPSQPPPTSLATADGRVGGPGASPPLGQATVLTGADTLRHHASALLENTTFIPRLPDYIHSASPDPTTTRGKFDIIVASHTLWPIREDFNRKQHVANLWSLLRHDGGVLIIVEKGVARGFEAVAGARDMLLKDGYIADVLAPSSPHRRSFPSAREGDIAGREKSMIIAPCTNHTGCPLYTQKGFVRERREICAFPQRYRRPVFLQRVYNAGVTGARASGKNFDDVEFSYLSVWRGRDLRAPSMVPERNAASSDSESADAASDFVPETMTTRNGDARLPIYITTPPSAQDEEATLAAFRGHASVRERLPSSSTQIPSVAEAPTPLPHSLTLPRLVFPPLKRTGHVILDVCTPAGALERWTVPKSHGRQAFRDARKSAWGDLWGLGAKTRVGRNLKKDKAVRREENLAKKTVAERKAAEIEAAYGIDGRLDDDGRVMEEGTGEFDGGDGGGGGSAASAPASPGDLLRGQRKAEAKRARRRVEEAVEVGYEDEGGRKGQVRKGWIKGIRDKRDKTGRKGPDDLAQAGGRKKRRVEREDEFDDIE